MASNRYLGVRPRRLARQGSRERVAGRAAGVDVASMEVLEAHSLRRGRHPTLPRPTRAPPSLTASMSPGLFPNLELLREISNNGRVLGY